MNARAGDPFSVTAVVSNTGIDDASNVLVEVFATGPSGQNIAIDSERVPQIEAQSQTKLTLPIDTSGLAPGQYTITVQVNRLHETLVADEPPKPQRLHSMLSPHCRL